MQRLAQPTDADAVDRVVGTIRYGVDVAVEGVVHAKAVRSFTPHARITSIDTHEARRQPGVLAVITGADLDADPRIANYYGLVRTDQPVLAVDKIRYLGEPVAMVIAETVEQAQEAALLVEVDYEELPAVFDPREAMQPGAPAVHDDWPDNDCGTWHLRHGDLDAGWQRAERVIESTYQMPSANTVPFEPHVTIARWNDDGGLELWSSTQAPFSVRKGIAAMFDLPPERVRVHVPNLGGGFGGKGQIKIEPLPACAALICRRPVRMELDREEVFQTINRHAAWVTLRTGVSADGTFVARSIDVIYDAGAYAVNSPGSTGQAAVRAPGPYHVPNIEVSVTARYTNTVPTGSFRGAMTNQLAFAYESHVDEIAAALGMDPLEVRRRNLLRDGDVYATSETMHDVHFVDLIDNVADAIGWSEPPAPPSKPGVARGKGLGVILKSTPPSRSEGRVELGADGNVVVHMASVEMGQGVRATMAEIVAGRLGVSRSVVSVPDADTDVTPFDSLTAGSRSTFAMGSCLRQASDDLKQQLADLAEEQLEIAASDLEYRDGRVVVRGDPEAGKSYADLVRDAGRDRLVAVGSVQHLTDAFANPQAISGQASVHWHQGAAAAEVEVDLETGKVTLLRCHGACYAGKVADPVRVRLQNEGGMIWGIGTALYEELQYDNGQLMNPNFAEYMIPSLLDVSPTLTSSALESPDPDADMHGVGEMAQPAVTPAIANAVYNATGVRLREVPLTPERVLRALLSAAQTQPPGAADEQARPHYDRSATHG